MSQKVLEVAGIGDVVFVKRRGSKSIKLTITADNKVRVSLPTWVPYQAGVSFVKSKVAWLETHRKLHRVFNEGDLIGKAHRLHFFAGETVKSRLTPTELRVTLGPKLNIHAEAVQAAVRAGAVRALRQEAEELLPQRLKQLANLHGYGYRYLDFKKLKGRWGSCSNAKDITLNIFLMTLPWNLIDYVLVHELIHTKVLHHSQDFWTEFQRVVPDAKQRRKLLKAYSPYF